jgi:hypothetical protein
VADEQQTPVGGHATERVERLDSVEASAERRMHGEQCPLRLAPRLGRELSGLARAHARAEQHRVEVAAQALDRDAGGERLLAAPLGQAALGVRARAVRLSLRVTK